MKDEDLLDQFNEHYQITKSGLMAQYKHINECLAFYAGDYMNYKDNLQYGRGSSRKIKEVSFNRVKPYVNSIVGFMAQQRRKPDYQARIPEKQDQRALSDYLNGLSDYVRDNTNADQHETKADKAMVIGGIGVTDTGITLKSGLATRLPAGEIIVENVDPREVGYDPAAVQTNILDSRWVYRCKDYDVQEAIDLFDVSEEDFELITEDDGTVYQFNPYGGIQDKIGFEWADKQRRMVRVYFYQWYEIETFYRIENPLLLMPSPDLQVALFEALGTVENDEEMFSFNPSEQVLTITKDVRNDVRKIFKDFGLKFNPVNHKRKVYYTAIISGDKVFTQYKSPSQQGFSLKFKTGDRDEVNNIWTGIVASMKEPQRYYNKALTELMLIIASNSRGGVMYEESAIDNVQEFEQKWARYNAAIKVNDGALSGGKIQPKATPSLNTGYEQILAISDQNFGSVSGIDESFFGAIAGGNETAMLQRQRIKQATTTLACYFDSILLYTKEQARMMLSYMRLLADASDGSVFMMYDDDGNNLFETLSPNFFAEEYDVVIGEAPETPMQKEYYTQTLISLGQGMQAIGDMTYKQIYAMAIKYMPMPDRDKNKIVEALTGDQGVDPAIVEQLQAQIQQLQGEQAQIFNAKQIAETQKILASVKETAAKIEKTQQETAKTLEETEQVARENDLMTTVSDVNVTI